MKTYCRICEAACGLEAVPSGTGVKLRPDRQHPVSRGFVCAKGTRFAEVASHPSRVTRPMRRDGGQLAPIPWDRALDEVSERLRSVIEAHGPHAVALYIGNPLAFHALGQLSAVFFGRALETRNVFTAGSQDCNNKFAGAQLMHGSPVIHPIPDFENADLAVLFGTNPLVSQGSFVHLEGGSTVFDRMKARGARTIFVDVRQTESVGRWGELVLVRPGTDVALLLALLGHFADRAPKGDPAISGLEALVRLAREVSFERAAMVTGVPESQLVELARTIERADRTAFHMSVGVNQGPFGTLSYVALQALAYLTGNYDRSGGSLFSPLGVGGARVARRAGLFTRTDRSRIGEHPTVFESLPAGILADEILEEGDERIRALVVVAGDPIRSVPGSGKLRRALDKLETLVSIDLFESETARQADYLLPATSWLERSDLALPGLPLQTVDLLQTTEKVLPRIGEARPEHEILADLALRLRRPLFSSTTLSRLLRAPGLVDRAFSALHWLGSTLLPSRHAGYGLPIPTPQPGRYLGHGPMTEGHRVRFWHPELDPERDRLRAWLAAQTESPDGFVLLGRRRRIGHNSWLHGGTRERESPPEAWLSQSDFADLGLEPGGLITLRTEAGDLTLSVRPDPGVPAGSVVVPHGEWKANVNELIGTDAIEPLSGMLLMTGVKVDVSPGVRAYDPEPVRA